MDGSPQENRVRSKRQTLFVQGIQKTGTSTLVGILNCHPEVFILYETRLDRSLVSNYGNQLLERFPGARRFFRNTTDTAEPYVEFFDWLETQQPEFKYRFAGDKIIDFDPTLSQRDQHNKIIFTMRDLRSWLCKEQIVRYYRTDLDVVPPAIEFLKYVIGTFKVADGYRVWLEDLIQSNSKVITGLSGFLGLELGEHTEAWWDQISQRDAKDPKQCIGWHKGHPSSNLAPRGLDTSFKIRMNGFWEQVTPLMEKYRNVSGTVDPLEIESDLELVESLRSSHPLPLQDCYESMSTTRLGMSPATSNVEPPKPAIARRSFSKRVRKLFRLGRA
ncbi:MAG: hypothetical protein AAF456_12785 [Planctomycetota bacterium]